MMLRSFFVWFLFAFPVTAADVALVDDELGQALLVRNRGLCYAILPHHVSPRDRVALAVPEPAEVGAAEIFWRDPDQDLALAYVEGTLGSRCQIELSELGGDLSRLLQRTETGMIKSVHFGGDFFDRIGAALIDVGETFITVRVTESGIDAEVMQGLSGAMLSVGGTVAGIAIDADEETGEARFLRMDRIAARVRANLGRDHPDGRKIGAADSGLGFRVTGFQGGDKAGVISLEPGSLASPWVAEWTGEPVSFEVTLSNDTLVPINRIRMGTRIEEQTTAPRRIALEIDRGMPGAPYWTTLAAPDMSPTGVFDTSTGGTVGRRLRIRILDVWYGDRPLRLDALRIE